MKVAPLLRRARGWRRVSRKKEEQFRPGPNPTPTSGRPSIKVPYVFVDLCSYWYQRSEIGTESVTCFCSIVREAPIAVLS